VLGEAAAGSDGGAASAGEIVAIGPDDAFDDAKMAQTGELSGKGGRRALAEERQQVGAAETSDVEAGTLRGGEQGLFGAAEKVKALEVSAFDRTGLVETVEHPDASREVVQTGELFEIAAVAIDQDLTQAAEVVDGLSDGGEGAGCRAVPMFPPPPSRGPALAVVLESGDVVGGGLDAQDEAEFVVDLDRGFAETMLDAGALDPRCELTANLLSELGSDLVAEKVATCSPLTVRMACRDSGS
jgi:hypothetical protein